MSAFVNDRRFPAQIDSLGHNIVETLDDLGDIKSIKFQDLILDDIADPLDDGRNIREVGHISKSCNSLLITITIRPKGKTREQPHYCVILADQLHKHSNRSSSASAYFDLVLLKAPAVIGQLVMQWLERTFDCRICRLLLQSYELRTIVDSSLEVMYGNSQGHADRRARPIELHYSFPESIDTLKSISISLAPDDARQLLVSRKEDSIAGFLDGVEAHCSDNMKIDFGHLSLVRAGCASWYIASEGKVKIFPAIEDKQSVADFIREIAKCGT
ncbi:kinetochore complex Sim4 subunit Fta1-domain-containing protein [Dissophora ornata]|nr:kinetochore complex Sim4 subunit Fta1-domain-containing protein [Dissophora ornata]